MDNDPVQFHEPSRKEKTIILTILASLIVTGGIIVSKIAPKVTSMEASAATKAIHKWKSLDETVQIGHLVVNFRHTK